MTETTGPTEAMAGSNLSISPSDILLHLIITFLAPRFSSPAAATSTSPAWRRSIP